VEQFKGVVFDFFSAELYKNSKNESILLLLTTNTIFFIDLSRREIRATIRYSDILDVELESDEKVKIVYRKEINGVNFYLK
jgi:hypothetical protein